MKPIRSVLSLLAIALLLTLPARTPVAAEGGGQIQWEKHKPVPLLVAPREFADSTPCFYRRKSEWKKIVDEYWGPGAPLAEKQRIFNLYADYIQRYFTAFEGLGISWDSLRSHYYSQINDSTSHGRFSALLSYMAYALREPHAGVLDFTLMEGFLQGETSGINEPRWGKPVWIKCAMPNARHFGAVLTPLADSSAVVIRAMQNHPLNLQRGDVVLGYEGVPWRQIARELLAAEVPSNALYGGSRSMEMHHFLASAGFNWHLFDTIDIVKYGTGDTLHLPVESLASIVMTDTLYNNECLEIPGVPWPDWRWFQFGPNRAVSSGIVAGTNIGYIYVSAHTHRSDGDLSPDSEELFNQAIADLWNTDGLIIDLRADRGGRVKANFNSAFGKLINFDTHTVDYYWRQGPGSLTTLTPYPYYPAAGGMAIDADEESVYDRPIAVLVGPGCVSMGDITAYRLTYFPNVRFFGKATSMGWGGAGEWPGIARPQVDGFALSASEIMLRDHYQPDRDFERIEFPVDEEVWLTREDVAKGDDTVVKRALAWITSVAHAHDVAASCRWLNAGTDTVRLTAVVDNPNGHPISLMAYFKADSIVVDSAAFADDGLHGDGAGGDGVWGTSCRLPAVGQFYSAGVRVIDPADPSTFFMPYVARFTTTGPLTCAGYSITSTDTVPNPGNRLAFKIQLKNNGSAVTIPAVTARVTALDSGNIAAVTVQQYGDVAPGAVALPTGALLIQFSSTHPGMYVAQFAVDISSRGIRYWRDTMRVVVTGIEGEEIALPTQFSLSQNYPNPFNPTTIISYQLPVVSNVKLAVYDILGREVLVLVNERKNAGTHEVSFDASRLSTGVYLYRLQARLAGGGQAPMQSGQAGDFDQAKKLIVLK